MGCNPQKNNCYYFSRHLWETLADIPTYGLTVIEAPSGFGKTTALREYLARELCYIKKLRPHMIGIGPFIPHKDTVFAKETGGSLDLTLNLVAMLRLMNPNAMIPATTAVGTIDPRGREKAILSGANVVMPNLSPVSVRKNYMLYDNKLCTGDEAAECRKCLDARIRSIGYEIVTDRGDYREF